MSTIKFTLDEALAINEMLDVDGIKLKDVASITANSALVPTRTVHSLRYKFKEGAITSKDKEVKITRSLRQFTTNEELFGHFGETFVDAADVASRIANFKAKLVLPVAETTTA